MVYRPMNLPQNMQMEFYRDPRQRLAERLIGQGVDTSPVQHWTQGAGRLAQALVGTLLDSRSRDEYQSRADKYGQDMKTIFAPTELPANEMDSNPGARPATYAEMLQRAAGTNNPDLGPLTQQLAMTHATTQAEDSRFKSRLATELEAKKQAQADQPETFGAPTAMRGPNGPAMVQIGSRGTVRPVQGYQPTEQTAEAPSSVRTWQFYNSLPDSEKPKFVALLRANPAVNLGGSYAQLDQMNPGTVVGEIPKTVPPEQAPQNKADVAQAVGQVESEQKKRELMPKAQSALQQFERQTKIVTDTIDKALGLAQGSMTATGYGNMVLGGLPNTDARALNNYLDTIKANIGFDRLQQMRDASPTGGALGAVSEMENRLLQAVNGAMDPLQGDQLIQNLTEIRSLYPQVLEEKRRAFQSDYGGGQGVQQLPPMAAVPQAAAPQVQPAVATPGQPQQRRRRYNPATGEVE